LRAPSRQGALHQRFGYEALSSRHLGGHRNSSYPRWPFAATPSQLDPDDTSKVVLFGSQGGAASTTTRGIPSARRLQAFCAKHGIPLIEAQARDRKHELAQPYLPNDPNFSGLFLVIKGNAPAPIWDVKRNGDGQITEIRHRKSWPYVRHFILSLDRS
jgi:hypothetical protein